jgi:HSP20 family protein
MNIKSKLNLNWLKRIFNRNNIGKSMKSRTFEQIDRFKEFNNVQEEFGRLLNHFYNIQPNVQKVTIKEFQTPPDGNKVRQIRPIIFGYSMTIGPDGKLYVREFGNAKSFGRGIPTEITASVQTREGVKIENTNGNLSPTPLNKRDSLVDITSTNNEVKVILEILGVNKEDIKINAFDRVVEVIADNNHHRKYHKTIELPKEADIETAKSTYNNGILEVTFNKKKNITSTGKEIKKDTSR